jgi:hypothetical protein
MNLQDRAYAAAIFIVLGICCIGAYVAVSGFMNANPQGLNLGSNGAAQTATLESAVEIPTDTPAPPTATLGPTEVPTRTPKGFGPSATPTIRRPPTLDLPTVPVTELITATPPTPTQVGCGYPFCGRLGKPDPNMGPKGVECPTDYLWGVVYDKNGNGISNWEVRYQRVGGDSGHTITKGPPDIRLGVYEIVAANGTWNLSLYDPSGNVKSPPFQVKAGQPSSGGTTCPSRVDFVEQ